ISLSEVREAMENAVPMKRMGQPEEYASLVCFLASYKASYITGTNIPIDGGLLKSV
ncbi:SDR family oxidoreductase, partial [Flavobacteriaceae bacterium]|nr:SDR family oxidoreductase [Flavobacteriaceae bacterium]